jgi:ribose transport system substrate-binding protein
MRKDTSRIRRPLFAVLLAGFALLPGCGGDDSPRGDVVTIGLVAKSQGNAVFTAAYEGAKAAAKELGEARGITVEIDWQTPPSEDAQKQAEAIEQLARRGVKGIAVAVSAAGTVTPAIDKAVELGAAVMCFDSDAPDSKRFCFFGTNDIDCGEAVMTELAAAMGGKGTIAILAGNQAAPNLRNRVQGVLNGLERYPAITLLDDGIFYHPETPEQAAETLNTAQTNHPEITGWALIGGWPLFTRGALRWPPGSVKVVSVDALPDELLYLDSGHVEVLLAQDCFGWGYTSVRVLLDKILDDVEPDGAPILYDPLTRVTAAESGAWKSKWEQWLAR